MLPGREKFMYSLGSLRPMDYLADVFVEGGVYITFVRSSNKVIRRKN